MTKTTPFVPGRYYHLYNHAISDDDLFREPANYRYFLKVYAAYASPVADTFAFCLMPNHFHFLIRVRPGEDLQKFFAERRKPAKPKPPTLKNLSNQVGQQLGNGFNAYAKAFNKRYRRRGRLFFASVQRKPVGNTRYLKTLVRYIHWNPVHHGFVDSPEDWLHSSYQRLLASTPDYLARDELFGLYGGEAAFKASHASYDARSLERYLSFSSRPDGSLSE